MRRYRSLAVASAAVFFGFAAFGGTISYTEDATVTETLTMSEATEISVASGVTVTYEAAISGDYKLTKSGAGTLILKAANTFGSLDINAGIVTVGAVGALGSGAITIAGATKSYCQLRFDTTLIQQAMTVNGAITLSSASALSYPAIYFVLPTASQSAIWAVTFKGAITANGNLYMDDNHGGKSGSESTGVNWEGKKWVVFDNAVNVSGFQLMYGKDTGNYGGPCGDVYFNGKVTSATFYCHGYTPKSYGSGGNFYFASSENQIGAFNVRYNNIYLTAKNAMGDAKVDIQQGYSATRSNFYLYGDQWAKSLTGAYKSDKCKIIKAMTSPYILTLDGGSSDSASTGIGLMGPLTLVVDASDADFVQTYNAGISTMSGPIIISNGTFKITGASTFASVPSLDIQSGTLEINSTSDLSFSSVDAVNVANGGLLKLSSTTVMPFTDRAVDLVLGETGKVYIPEGVTLLTRSLTINGQLKPAGQYTATELANNITGGGTLDTFGTAAINTWTGGGGEDKSFTNQSNWKDTVSSFTDGNLAGAFATGDGVEAVVGSTVRLSKAVFDTPAGKDGFTFTKDGDGKMELVMATEFADDPDANETPHTYAFNVPLTLLSEHTWTVPVNDTLKVTEGITAVDLGLTMDGKGAIELGGTNTIDGRLMFTKFSRLTLKGKITASDPSSQGTPSSVATGHSLYIDHLGVASGAQVANVPVVLDNVYIDKPIYIDTQDSNKRKLIYCKPSTTNVFARGFGTVSVQFEVAVDADAVLAITGGATPSWSFYKSGSGLLRVAENSWRQGSSVFSVYGGTSRFEVTGNKFNRLIVNGSSARLEFAVDDAIESANTCEITSGTFDIQAGTQRVPFVLSNTSATLTGSEGTVLHVTNGGVPVDATQYGTTNLRCQITGAVGITQGGANKLVLNTVANSTGPLMVTNGVLELTAAAKWNGSSITAKGNGKLKFSGSDQIGSGVAQLHIADNGKVEIPEGVTVFVNAADLDGTPVGVGNYTSASTEAIGAHISGSGTLKVGKRGTMLILQ